MGIQARMTESDPRLYNVGRDVAHNFGHVMTTVAERLEAGGWEPADRIAKDYGVTQDELGKACEALCLFVAKHMEHKESMSLGLARVGFLDLHPMARVLTMAWLGNVILGMHWAGVREATLGGVGPAMTYQDLVGRGAECAKLMTMSRWRRRWHKLSYRVRRVFQVLRGGG